MKLIVTSRICGNQLKLIAVNCLHVHTC